MASSSSRSSDTDFKPSEELAKERYDSRANEDIEKKRARLLYQSRKRGMLENGVILASFANKYLHKLDAEHLDQYDRLINLPTNDWDIFYWATKTKPTPPQFETPVMELLREHLNSKVSKDDSLTKPDGVLGKTRPDDIVMPAAKKVYELDVDLDRVSMTNYQEQLFDDRVKVIGSATIMNMTPWRKRFFERRLRRKVSSPASLRALNDDKLDEMYTQKSEGRELVTQELLPRDLLDSYYERNMKHHNFMQHLFSNNLTDNALEYDDEAEAWADMLWHRNYGSHDAKVASTSDLKCNRCLSNLHCCDPGLDGYMPRELFTKILLEPDSRHPSSLLCQKCKFTSTYDAKLGHDITPQAYEQFLRRIGSDKSISVVVILCDLTDFPGSIWKGLVDIIGNKSRIIVVGNKLDLLPYDGPKLLPRVLYSMRKNLDRLRPGNRNKYIHDVIAISARTGFGVEGLVSRLLSYCETPQDIYLIGNSNTGKSTLFNALMQTDLCAIRKGDILSRVTRYNCPVTNMNMLKFPIDWAEGWQIELKKQKAGIIERNVLVREKALGQLSERRQESMPHMSMLINRLEYTQEMKSDALVEKDQGSDSTIDTSRPKFTEDHPLANVDYGDPLSASEDKFKYHKFFHHTPSATHPDQIHDLLTFEERLEVFHNETIIPRKYSLRPLNSIFIAGLARLDLLTSQSNIIFTIFTSKYLPIHVVPTKNADKFYHSFLGTAYLGIPRGNDQRLAAWPELVNACEDYHIRGEARHTGAADVVLSSIGWATVSPGEDQECIVRAYTPEGRGIFLRTPPLLSRPISTRFLGRKLRDTPMFRHPHFSIEKWSAKKTLTT